MSFPIFSLNKALISYRNCLEEGASSEIINKKQEKVSKCFKTLEETYSYDPRFSRLHQEWSHYLEHDQSTEGLSSIIKKITNIQKKSSQQETSLTSGNYTKDLTEISPDIIKGWTDTEFTTKFLDLSPQQQSSFLQFHFAFDDTAMQMKLRQCLIATFRAALFDCPGQIFTWLEFIPNPATKKGYLHIVLRDLFQQSPETIFSTIRRLGRDQQSQLFDYFHEIANSNNIRTIIDIYYHFKENKKAAEHITAALACKLRKKGIQYCIPYLQALQGQSAGFMIFFVSVALSTKDLSDIHALEAFCNRSHEENDLLRTVLVDAGATHNLTTAVNQLNQIINPKRKVRDARVCINKGSLFASFVEDFLHLNQSDQDFLLCSFFHERGHENNSSALQKIAAVLKRLLATNPKRAFECLAFIKNKRQLFAFLRDAFSALSKRPLGEIKALLQVTDAEWRFPAILGLLEATPNDSILSLYQELKEYLTPIGKEEMEHAIGAKLLHDNKELLREMLLGMEGKQVEEKNERQIRALDQLLSHCLTREELEFFEPFIQYSTGKHKELLLKRYCLILSHFNLTAAIEKSKDIKDPALESECLITLFLQMAKREDIGEYLASLPEDHSERLMNAYFEREALIDSADVENVMSMFGQLALRDAAALCRLFQTTADKKLQKKYAKMAFRYLATKPLQERHTIISRLVEPWKTQAIISVIKDFTIWNIKKAIEEVMTFTQENSLLRQTLLQKIFDTVVKNNPEEILAFMICDKNERIALVRNHNAQPDSELQEHSELVAQLLA